LFAAGLTSPDRFEQVASGLFAVVSGAAVVRLTRVRICRSDGEYLIVNLLRTYRVAIADVRDASTPRLLRGKWFPWTRLLLTDGSGIWITALPADAKSRSLVAFLEDFERVRPQVVPETYLPPTASRPGGRRGWPSWSWRRRMGFIAWGIGETVALVLVIILGPKTLPAVSVVVAALWVPFFVLILIRHGRRQPRRSTVR